jgi:hypothetical protein
MNKEYMKISSCIESSTTQKHLEVCDRLIKLFEKKFKSLDFSESELMVSNLNSSLDKKKLVIG